ncbi:hypothetical protein NQ317_014862 [Molorchus minor]|uniref:Tyr recombinase domain-containing protein n=1 Tax=Molorchus minor TaxID=1323400 RepID=A0ABQ9JRU2_9CUCU|nr:hypothetical protein NQ317_014862 [Molorchus minor]
MRDIYQKHCEYFIKEQGDRFLKTAPDYLIFDDEDFDQIVILILTPLVLGLQDAFTSSSLHAEKKALSDVAAESSDVERVSSNLLEVLVIKQMGKYAIRDIFLKTKDEKKSLNTSDCELYTGHCFRRTSASFLADSGANLCTIKRHGGWKSSSVAEGYLEDSLENKKRIACHILPNNCPSSNNSEIEHINSISSTASSLNSTISSCEVASSQGINIRY